MVVADEVAKAAACGAAPRGSDGVEERRKDIARLLVAIVDDRLRIGRWRRVDLLKYLFPLQREGERVSPSDAWPGG